MKTERQSFLSPSNYGTTKTGPTARHFVKAVVGLALCGAGLATFRAMSPKSWVTGDIGPTGVKPMPGRLRGLQAPSNPYVGCADTPSKACPPTVLPINPESSLTICTMVRDEPDMQEWIDFHRKVGVESFLIYDNNSSTPLSDTLPAESLAVGDLRIQYINEQYNAFGISIQHSAYKECLEIAHHHKWIAFLDADEFMVPINPDHNFLPDFFAQFSNTCAVALNWRVFGSSNHSTKPEGKRLENYTKCTEYGFFYNYFTKVVANPLLFTGFERFPHGATCRDETFMVTESGERQGLNESSPVQMVEVSLYHFATGSKEEYQKKSARGGGNGTKRPLEFITEVDGNSTEECLVARDLSRSLG